MKIGRYRSSFKFLLRDGTSLFLRCLFGLGQILSCSVHRMSLPVHLLYLNPLFKLLDDRSSVSPGYSARLGLAL